MSHWNTCRQLYNASYVASTTVIGTALTPMFYDRPKPHHRFFGASTGFIFGMITRPVSVYLIIAILASGRKDCMC